MKTGLGIRFQAPFRILVMLLFALSVIFLLASCPATQVVFYNYLPIDVGTVAAPNIPVVSVTVCVPGTTNCRTVPNIEVDTASIGLRIFSQALSITLPPEQSGTNPIAECLVFGSGSAWGPVSLASVTLGGEPSINVPIQIIDSTFGTASPPVPCDSDLLVSPGSLGNVNGILGVEEGQFDQSFEYFVCQSGSCTAVAPPSVQQVQNPVFLLPQDNNGIFVFMSGVPNQGAAQGTGALILGIGTGPGNDPQFVSSGNPYSILSTSSRAFNTTYKGNVIFPGFIDTGTNFLIFPDSSIPTCTIGISSEPFYCPQPSPMGLIGANSANTGPSENVGFLVANPSTLLNSGRSGAFNDLAIPFGFDGGGFDWGLPFFFGRSVFIAYSHTVLGDTPLWGWAGNSQSSAERRLKVLQKQMRQTHPQSSP